MNAVELAVAAAGRAMQSVAGVKITYRRGGQALDLVATVGSTTFEAENLDLEEDGIQEIRTRDYLITDTVRFIAAMGNPQSGDRTEEAASARAAVRVSEVNAPGREPCFSYADPSEQILRIHTKQVGTQS